jgi:Hg(II)-responsive transcriptional regulator
MDRDTLRTGEVAAQAGVNAQTLRYYERRGLLKQPERRRSGYREYPPDTIAIIRFIKHAQELGFTLTEVEELLRLRDDQHGSCSEVRAAAQAKMEDIEQKIRCLRAIRDALELLVSSCTSDDSVRRCPILEALDDGQSDAARATTARLNARKGESS